MIRKKNLAHYDTTTITHPLPHPVVVSKLVPLRFTLVGTDEQHQPVSVEELLSHIGAKVAAAAPEGVGPTAGVRVRVTPQQVQYLGDKGEEGGSVFRK